MAPKGNAKTKNVSKGGKNQKVVEQQSSEVTPPRWPILKPLVPISDLGIETIHDGQIVVIRKFFTSSLCQNYVSFLGSLPLTTTPGQPKKGDAVRVNDRFQIQDPGFARSLWESTSLKGLVTKAETDWGGQVCGLNPNIRIYRYTKGQFFDQHYDESNSVALSDDSTSMARTTWTLLIYLTGSTTGCIGGETVFYPEGGNAKGLNKKSSRALDPISVAPEVGLALLHKHGDDCLLHEGKMVEGGEKWIIRSDLCVSK